MPVGISLCTIWIVVHNVHPKSFCVRRCTMQVEGALHNCSVPAFCTIEVVHNVAPTIADRKQNIHQDTLVLLYYLNCGCGR